MFSKKERYIIRDKNRRSIFIKYKFRYKLVSTILKNNTFGQKKKLLLKVNFVKNPSQLKKKNICLLSGENNTVHRRFLE
jgi:hypothetical protein